MKIVATGRDPRRRKKLRRLFSLPNLILTATLGALGAERAWLLGDRAAPLKAARSAGLVPVGLRPPGAEAAGPANDLSLLAAGAGRVLRSLSELEEVWP